MQEKILEFIFKQGFSIFILVIAIWWFNGKYEDRDQELKQCQDARVTTLTTVVEDNTKSNYELINYLKSQHDE